MHAGSQIQLYKGNTPMNINCLIPTLILHKDSMNIYVVKHVKDLQWKQLDFYFLQEGHLLLSYRTQQQQLFKKLIIGIDVILYTLSETTKIRLIMYSPDTAAGVCI